MKAMPPNWQGRRDKVSSRHKKVNSGRGKLGSELVADGRKLLIISLTPSLCIGMSICISLRKPIFNSSISFPVVYPLSAKMQKNVRSEGNKFHVLTRANPRILHERQISLSHGVGYNFNLQNPSPNRATMLTSTWPQEYPPPPDSVRIIPVYIIF